MARNYDERSGARESSADRPRNSIVPSSRSRSKSARENAFARYMKKNYIEHFRRIVSWRRAARWVLFTYPVTSATLFATPFAVLEFVFKKLYASKPEWFTNALSADSQSIVMPILYGLILFSGFFGLVLGIGLGISRSRLLTFEAERTELTVRQNYFLRRIARGQRGTSRRS